MKISCSIIGLPNVGKSTLFSLLTNIVVKISNFPFCTIQPNIAIIKIPDVRLYQLNDIVQSRTVVHEKIKFIDVAGLIPGAYQGVGLGIQILNHIQTTQIFIHVVRCFDNDGILHIKNNINPSRDIDILNIELILFDIEQCEKHIDFLKKNRMININKDQNLFILEKCLNYLNDGISLRNINFSQSERKNILNFNFLTYKPVIYIANVDRHYKNNIYVQKLNEIGFRENSPVILHCFMNNGEFIANSQRTILHELIDNIMFFLKLNTFFTTNINMTRSWIYESETIALDAAYNIHSDFKKGFIRAQIIKFNDFIANHGESGAKKSGRIRYEGKNYLIEEGDIIKFLFKN